MTETPGRKRFTLDQNKTGFARDELDSAKRFGQQIRDKDNAQPRVKPPEQARTPHPRLAPPGAAGIRPGLGAVAERAAPPPPKMRTEPGEQGKTSRTFKPLVQKSPDKGRTPER